MKNHVLHLCLAGLFLLAFFSSSAQEPISLVEDTASIAKDIDLSEISRKSAELTLKAKDLVKEIITREELQELKNKNQALTHSMDSLLVASDVNVSTLSVRNLNGKIIYWELNLKEVKSHESELQSIFEDMSDNRESLKKELSYWRAVDKSIEGEQMTQTIHSRFNQVEKMIDTTLLVLDSRSAEILLLLDNVSRIVLDIETFISNIKTQINNQQEDIFFTDQDPLYRLEFLNKDRWVLSKSMWQYYKGNFDYLIEYVKKHISQLLFQIFFILFLIFVLKTVATSKIDGGKEVGGVYKKRLKLLLGKPVSTALVVGIFANPIIYQYRPLLFMDISRVILIFPVVIVLNKILPRKYHSYVILFALAIFLQIIYLNLPIDNIISRLILVVIAVLIIVPMLHFILRTRKNINHRLISSHTFLFISYLLILTASAGLIANFFGRVMLSLMLLESILGLLLVSIIISLSLIVINGLSVIFIDSHRANAINVIKNNREEAKTRLTRLFYFAAVLVFLYFMLNILNLDTPFFDWMEKFLTKERNIGMVVYNWGNIFVFFLVLYLSTLVAGFIRAVLEDDVFSRVKMEKGLPHTIALLVKYSLVTLGVVLAISAIGIPLDSLTVILGAFGVGIGFGLQNIFNNLVSGLILLFERPIKINDTIEVGSLLGNVRSIGIRASNVRTFDGAEIIVPNGNLISNEVVNWTLSDQKRRIEVIVGVSYKSDPHQAHDVLLNVLKKHKDIINDPEPVVFFNELGDSSLNFRLLFWTFHFDQWLRIRSEVIFQAFDDLKEAGIEIPFPQRDLHVRSIDTGVEFKTIGASSGKKEKENEKKKENNDTEKPGEDDPSSKTPG